MSNLFGGCSTDRSSTRLEKLSDKWQSKKTDLDRQLIPIQIGEHQLSVEVASLPEDITLGLGNRNEIGSDGMLFVFPEKRPVSFWMYQMRFPLDIVWIDGDRVIGLTTNLPPPEPSQPVEELPSYPSPAAVNQVLEINAGRVEELGITVGDLVKIDRPI